MRILLVEDDPLLGDALRAGLRQQGFQVDWVREGPAAERELLTGAYQAAVLDLGADDYVVKPVDLDELAARLRALVRRAHGQVEDNLRVGEVELRPGSRDVFFRGERIALAVREFDLLHALLLNAGRVLTRDQIEQHLYSWGREVESNAIEVHIHHLRKKLAPELIETVRGVGYMVARVDG